MRRIVVTGYGIVSPLGCGVGLVWQRLLAGRSGIRRLSDNLVPDVRAKIAGIVPTIDEDAEGGFDPDRAVSAKDQMRMDRFIQFAMAAANEAIAQSGWAPSTDAERNRTATIIASGIGGFATMKQAVHTTDQRGPRKLSPFTVPSFLVNLAAGQISIHHGFRGPIGAPVTACAASLQALGDGARLIRSGEADIAVCGGSESCIERVSLASFAAAPADGEGLQRCMRLAIDAAGIQPSQVGHINAHATSTPLGDAAELTAIRGVFNGARVAITSTKAATGHLLGAAGAVGAIFAVNALRTGLSAAGARPAKAASSTCTGRPGSTRPT